MVIYNLLGRVIRREAVRAVEPIDISLLLKGIYMIRIFGSNHGETPKLIKK